MKIIGYAYEAAIHCPDCRRKRWPVLHDGIRDCEGNPIHPIFDTDEQPEGGEFCGDCGEGPL